MAFKARKLRHRIDIEKLTNRQDSETGDNRLAWSVIHSNIPAEIAPLSVREFISSQALQSQIVARIVIRHIEGLDASMRIIHRTALGTRIYNPQGWQADADSGIEYLTAPCTQGTDEG